MFVMKHKFKHHNEQNKPAELANQLHVHQDHPQIAAASPKAFYFTVITLLMHSASPINLWSVSLLQSCTVVCSFRY